MPRDHNLRGIIIIGDCADFAFRRCICQCLCFVDIRAEKRRHRTDAKGHRRLHCLPTQFEQLCCGRQIKGTRRAKRAIFPQRMACDIIGLIRQPHTAFAFKHTQRRNRIGHDRWLRIFREHQITLSPITHHRKEMLTKRIIDFLKHLPRDRAGCSKRLSHAH